MFSQRGQTRYNGQKHFHQEKPEDKLNSAAGIQNKYTLTALQAQTQCKVKSTQTTQN